MDKDTRTITMPLYEWAMEDNDSRFVLCVAGVSAGEETISGTHLVSGKDENLSFALADLMGREQRIADVVLRAVARYFVDHGMDKDRKAE